MVSLLTLTGGASLTGVLVYQGIEHKDAAMAWWKTSWQTVRDVLTQTQQRLMLSPAQSLTKTRDDQKLGSALVSDDTTGRYELNTSALALGVTAIGGLLAPPLQAAGMPILAFMGIPAAQAAYAQLQVNGRPNRALAETVALAVCLTGGYYVIGAFGFCLYHGGRRLLAMQTVRTKTTPSAAQLAPATTHLWKEGITCTVATETLHSGDQIMLRSGELVPVTGVITEGTAWLHAQALSVTACALYKRVGDRVSAQDIVMVGQICVQVLPNT